MGREWFRLLGWCDGLGPFKRVKDIRDAIDQIHLDGLFDVRPGAHDERLPRVLLYQSGRGPKRPVHCEFAVDLTVKYFVLRVGWVKGHADGLRKDPDKVVIYGQAVPYRILKNIGNILEYIDI